MKLTALSGSAVYCSSGSTFKTFGTIADCCTTDGTCHPATECFAGQIVFFNDGSASTCDGDCSTGFIYDNIGDISPKSMYGCFDEFDLYRTINGAAVTEDGSGWITVDGSSPSSSVAGSAPSETPPSTPSGSHIHPAIIAAVVAVVVALISAIAGLVTWVCLLKRRQKRQSPATELKPIPSDNNFGLETKAELPTKEVSAAELESPISDLKPQWSTIVSPVSTIPQQYNGWQTHAPQGGAMELSAYTMRRSYQELPG